MYNDIILVYSSSGGTDTDNEVATISKSGTKLSLPAQPEGAGVRLSPFSVLKERRLLSGNEDNSSSDDASPSRRSKRSRSPLIFSGSRGSDKSKHLVGKGQQEQNVDGETGKCSSYLLFRSSYRP